jgi:medium-chain acyl-[acyl-carrier-protein] hydrolase
MRSDHAPAQAFTLPTRVRSYEAGRNRRASLGTMLRLLEYLATEASSSLGYSPEWYSAQHSAWVVREMHIVLGDLPAIGDELLLGTWLSEWRRVQAYREYAVWHPGMRTLVARARGRWAYVDRLRGAPLRVPDEMFERFSPLGPAMRRPPAEMRAEGPPHDAHTMHLIARETEADVNQHINNTVYADWLVEALYRALREEPVLALNDHELRPRTYQIEYLRQTLPGDSIRIESHLAPVGTRALDVSQRVLDAISGDIIVRAVSRHLLMPSRA